MLVSKGGINMIKRFLNKLEKLFTSAAFAEAGEHEHARMIMGYESPVREASVLNRFSRLSMAVAFAEAGCHDTAFDMLGNDKPAKTEAPSSFAKAVGLEGIRVWYGVVEMT